MTSTSYDEAIKRATPFMQGLYRSFRSQGFDRATTKTILDIALKCAIVNEAFGEGIDNDAQNNKAKHQNRYNYVGVFKYLHT